MATTSKFVQLSSSVLLEYIYADLSVITTPGNPYNITTSNDPLLKNENGFVDNIQIWNSSESLMGNVRNRSFANISTSKIALTDINRLINFNNYSANIDGRMTSSANLPIVFNSEKQAIYDTVKIHLLQGFNFENHKGLAFTCKILDKNGKEIILNNTLYSNTDVWETKNTRPFFFGGKVFNTYLETKVLSSYQLMWDYWSGVYDDNSVVYKITNGIGLKKDQLIQIYFSWVDSYSNLDGQTYAFLQDTVTVDIPLRDQFESISAYIGESTSGDFIEFYGKYNGDIINQFIIDLNRSGNDFILLHDLILNEWIKNVGSEPVSVKTAELQLTQTSDYGIPNVWRPVIKNPNAFAYDIDYTIRLYNKADNSQVWKSSTMSSNNPGKYGRLISSINLGTTPVQPIIYNKKFTKEITINNISQSQQKFITSTSSSNSISPTVSVINSSNISISFSTTDNTGTSNMMSNSQVYPNGLGEILLTKYDSYLKFNIYKEDNNVKKLLDLNSIGNLVLEFSLDKDFIEISEYKNKSIIANKTNGEIVFFISTVQSDRILNSKNREFNLFVKQSDGNKTFIYSGMFYSSSEFNTLQKNKFNLQNQINTLTAVNKSQAKSLENTIQLNSSKSDEIASLREGNDQLTQQIIKATTEVMSDNTQISVLQTTITSLQNQNLALKKERDDALKLQDNVIAIQTKNTSLETINSELNNQMAQLQASIKNSK